MAYGKGDAMAQFERVREAVAGQFDEAKAAERERQGWRLVAVEWERGDAAEASPAVPLRTGEAREPVPYG
ncbi:MAG: hypothetical protein WA209_07395, partial [Candidatus Acidiferrales bacterium]